MQTNEFKQIFPQHIQSYLLPIDLINLIQVSKYLSSFATMEVCIDGITIKIEQALKKMLKQNYNWFIQIMQEYNMSITGTFIFDCIFGKGKIGDLGACIILDDMSDELKEKLEQKKYRFDPKLNIIRQPYRVSESLINVRFDRNVEKLHYLDIHKNYWSPGKLYFHKLFDVCLKEMSYEKANPQDVMKHHDLGFKFKKNEKVMTDAELKNELSEYLDIDYYNRCDHRTDTKMQEYLKRDPWYALKEPVVWSCGDKYVIKRSTDVYKNVMNFLDVRNVTVCDRKCLARFIFPEVEHFNHSWSVSRLREKQNLIIVNDLV